MSRTAHMGLRRSLAALVVAGATAIGAGLLNGTLHAAAQVVPNKTCTGSGPGGAARPGDTLTCVVSAAGPLVTGDTLTVRPTAPTGATIPPTGCVGVTAQGTAPFTYSTTATYTGGSGAGACTYTVTATTFGTVGNSVLGSEALTIPSTTAAGTSVTQEASQCGPVLPVVGQVCSPAFLPMGTSGAGSCVGGAAVPVLGGCVPALALPSTSASASSSSSSSASASDTASATADTTQSNKTGTPFTSGPDHPLPVAAGLVAAGGVLVALLAALAPVLRRRRRDI